MIVASFNSHFEIRKFKMLKKIISLASLVALSCQVSAGVISVPVVSHGCDLSVGVSCYIQLVTPLTPSQNLAGCSEYGMIRWGSDSLGAPSFMNALSKLQSEGKPIVVGISDSECFFNAPQAVWWRNDNI